MSEVSISNTPRQLTPKEERERETARTAAIKWFRNFVGERIDSKIDLDIFKEFIGTLIKKGGPEILNTRLYAQHLPSDRVIKDGDTALDYYERRAAELEGGTKEDRNNETGAGEATFGP